MKHVFKEKIREKTLEVEVEIFEHSYDTTERLPNINFKIEEVRFNGKPYEITTAERGELYRAIWHDDKKYNLMRDMWVGV